MNKAVTITVKGFRITLHNVDELRAFRDERPDLYNAIYTRDNTLINWALLLYQEELCAQDSKGSTGSEGKLCDVVFRVELLLANGQRVYLRDLRCRRPGMVDARANGVSYEVKTSLSGGDFFTANSYEDGLIKLHRKAANGLFLHFETEAFTIDMPLADFLRALEAYNPEKGLATWFRYSPSRGKLQMQVIRTSKRKMNYLMDLANA